MFSFIGLVRETLQFICKSMSPAMKIIYPKEPYEIPYVCFARDTLDIPLHIHGFCREYPQYPYSIFCFCEGYLTYPSANPWILQECPLESPFMLLGFARDTLQIPLQTQQRYSFSHYGFKPVPAYSGNYEG